jgi:hypothetical protein
LPAKIIVAPNSPNARAQVITPPLTSALHDSGTTTKRKTCQRLAPSSAAACLSSVSILRNPIAAALI